MRIDGEHCLVGADLTAELIELNEVKRLRTLVKRVLGVQKVDVDLTTGLRFQLLVLGVICGRCV